MLYLAYRFIKFLFKLAWMSFKAVFIGLYHLFSWLIGLGRSSAERKKQLAAEQAEKEREKAEQIKAEEKRLQELSKPYPREYLARLEEQDRKRIAAERREIERERERKFKIMQAVDDIEHLKQQKRDIYKCYAVALDELKNAGTDKGKEAAQNKCIKYDNKIRSLQKQIEKNQFILGRL